MAERREAQFIPWPHRLASAIVYRAFADYVQGEICSYEPSCCPSHLSEAMAKLFAIDAMNFFKSNWCKELTDLNCVQLAYQLKQGVPEFVDKLRVCRPKWNTELREDVEVFKCPNCGADVKVKWISKPSGIIKGKCTGCIYEALYNIPRKELMKDGS